MDDFEALRRFAVDGSQGAFGELVRRHVNLVYSAARRQMKEMAAAEDVTQAVFMLLTRKAGVLSRGGTGKLAGWLVKVTHFACQAALRGEARRRYHERKAMDMRSVTTEAVEAGWNQISPVLDAAMMGLSEADRAAVAMRCLEERSFAEVGVSLGVSEDAARKRVDRAIGKLRALLARRGVAAPGGLGAVLAASGAEAAPAGLRNALAHAASQGAWSGNAAVIGEGARRAMMALKIKVLAAAAIFLVTVGGVAIPMALHGGTAPAAAVSAPVVADEGKTDGGAGGGTAVAPLATPNAVDGMNADMATFRRGMLPRATYFADAARTAFPEGLLKDVDAQGRPAGWGDLSGMEAGKAVVGDDSARNVAMKAWVLSNDDPAAFVKVRAIVPMRSDWKKLAVMARLIGRNLNATGRDDSWAGVGFSFVDKDGRQVGDSVLLPASATKHYHQALMATLEAPEDAVGVLVTVEMSKAKGGLSASNIVVMPVDETKDAAPAEVVLFHEAILGGDVAQVRKMIAGDKALLECRNMDQTASAPLEIAARRDEEEMVAALLDMGADPKARDMVIQWSAMDSAAVQGSARALAVLLERTDVDLDEAEYYVKAGQTKPPGGADGRRDYQGCRALVEKARAMKGATTRPRG